MISNSSINYLKSYYLFFLLTLICFLFYFSVHFLCCIMYWLQYILCFLTVTWMESCYVIQLLF